MREQQNIEQNTMSKFEGKGINSKEMRKKKMGDKREMRGEMGKICTRWQRNNLDHCLGVKHQKSRQQSQYYSSSFPKVEESLLGKVVPGI